MQWISWITIKVEIEHTKTNNYWPNGKENENEFNWTIMPPNNYVS